MKKILPFSTPSLFEEEPAPIGPGFVDPMLASALDEDKSILDYENDGWTMEQKYDGHRLILQVFRRNGKVCTRAWSRAGNPRILPAPIAVACERLASATYDGELFLPGGTSTDVTRLHIQDSLQLVLFDILRVDIETLDGGKEGEECLMQLPGHSRREMLKVAASKLNEECGIFLAPSYPVSRASLQAIWDDGGEGAVIKNVNALYRPGKRSKDWIKFKRFASAVTVITGFIPGLLGPCSIVVAKDRDGIEVRAKARDDEWRRQFEADPESFIGRSLVIEHQGKASKGKYRSPMADHIL